jgi:hypothetical protein
MIKKIGRKILQIAILLDEEMLSIMCIRKCSAAASLFGIRKWILQQKKQELLLDGSCLIYFKYRSYIKDILQ